IVVIDYALNIISLTTIIVNDFVVCLTTQFATSPESVFPCMKQSLHRLRGNTVIKIITINSLANVFGKGAMVFRYLFVNDWLLRNVTKHRQNIRRDSAPCI